MAPGWHEAGSRSECRWPDFTPLWAQFPDTNALAQSADRWATGGSILCEIGGILFEASTFDEILSRLEGAGLGYSPRTALRVDGASAVFLATGLALSLVSRWKQRELVYRYNADLRRVLGLGPEAR